MLDKEYEKEIEGKSPPELVRMYFDHQYERIEKLEGQGLSITNIITTLIVLGFTFGYNKEMTLTIVSGVVLPLILIIINIFAVFYISRTSGWINTHRDRAKLTLRKYAPDLFMLDKEVLEYKKVKFWSRRKIQRYIHILLSMIALIPLTSYVINLVLKP
jgi:hypothetical protein